MDLHQALKKRGIRMMLYTGCTPYLLPGPASEKAGWFGKGYKFVRATPDGADHWIEVLQWYSDHYGEAVSGWWLDGLREWAPNYRQRAHAAVEHGNLKSIATSGTHALSDYIHGHCTANWQAQQKRLPPKGRWEPEYGIQWHAFQYLGHSWAANGTTRSTNSLVRYAVNVVQGGGVITFDIGAFDERPVLKGPYLNIRDDQMQQLRAVRDAVNSLDLKEQGR